ncbi:MAG: hypothetical protein WDN26_05325 [Chitinophagaceae bacterium]
MASTSETGHAKNIANFEDLISFCTGYGAAYSPGRESLTIVKMKELHATSANALQDTKTTKTAFDNASNKRRLAFDDLKPFSTRLVSGLAASGASALVMQDAKTVNKKIQGVRATPKPAAPAPGAEAATPSPKTISTSQLSYDSLIDHFTKLVEVVAQESNYTPNEAEMKVTGLQAKLQGLKTTNSAVTNTYTQWSNSRLRRNNILYNVITGLVPVALDAKRYIKFVFGVASPQLKQVSGLEFKTVID